jgi:ATP-dependent protease ClpP protease subunit
MTAQIIDGELVLYGFVGDSLWEDGFTASEVLACLSQLGFESDITVRLNSPGGYLDDGVAIYNAFAARKGKTRCVVDGVAASSASIIVMGADERVMRRGALLMIHDPSTIGYGTVEDFQKVIGQLEAGIGAMVSIYSDRSGESADITRATMKAETWLDAAAAVARGFATASEEVVAQSVAAFDYRLYAHAPDDLKKLAATKGWSLKAAGRPQRNTPLSNPQDASTMSNLNPQTPANPPVDAGKIKADITARIKAIMTADAAKGRESLAEYFALETDMPVEQVLAALGKAPAAVAAAATDPTTPGSPAPASGYEAGRLAAAGLAQPGGQPAGGGKAADLSPMKAAVDRYNNRKH